MKQIDRNIEAFFALVQAGLWEKEVRLLPFGDVDFDKVYRLASEQSVVGLVAAGLEHVSDMKLPKATVVPFMGAVLQMEQRNTAMNSFLVWLLDELRKKDVYALQVKGRALDNAMSGLFGDLVVTWIYSWIRTIMRRLKVF